MGAKQPVAAVGAGKITPSKAWRALATAPDEDRIDRLGLAWSQGLADAQKSYGSAIKNEGALLQPRAGLPRPDPTPGSYHCRLVELGTVGKKDKPFQAFKPFFCYVLLDGGDLTVVKQTGSQRPAGILYSDDDPNRLIFLGSMARGEKDQTLPYSSDPKRDLAGVFERVAPFRWRLVIPWPQDDAKIAIYELTPVPDQPK